jgi:hypothetical protein
MQQTISLLFLRDPVLNSVYFFSFNVTGSRMKLVVSAICGSFSLLPPGEYLHEAAQNGIHT